MMKTTSSYSDLVNQLVKVFSDANMQKEYNPEGDPGSMRQAVCGWCGVMSPLNRLAYVEDFGEMMLTEAEEDARKIIADREERFSKSHYASYAMMADKNQDNSDFIPSVGNFVWCISSGLKQHRTVRNEISSLVRKECDEKKDDKKAVLCRVDKVFHLSMEDFEKEETADHLVLSTVQTGEEFPGGIDSDDIVDTKQSWEWTEDEKRTLFMLGAAVVSPSGQWYIIDAEGYDYARYIYLPTTWKTMYSEQYQSVLDEREAERIAKEQKEAAEKAERKEAYQVRYDKWAPLMISIAPYAAELSSLKSLHSSDTKQIKAAERKLHNVCRSNILTMCRTAFPGVKFSLRRRDGWGEDWMLSWIDGPTEKEFSAAVDLRLFASGEYVLDAYSDYWDWKTDENTLFAEKFMGYYFRHGIEAKREKSASTCKDLYDKVLSVCPIFENRGHSTLSGLYDYFPALGEIFGDTVIDSVKDHICGSARQIYLEDMALWIFREISYYVPREKSEVQISVPVVSAALEVVEYSEKAIAVFGDTKEVKDQLKAMGGRFNGKLKHNDNLCAGWIFSKKKMEEVTKFVQSLAPSEFLPNPPAEVVIDMKKTGISADNADEVADIPAVETTSPLAL